MTNEELLKKMIEEMILRGLSPATMKYYRIRARTLVNYYASKPLADISDSEFRDAFYYGCCSWSSCKLSDVKYFPLSLMSSGKYLT